MTRRFAVVYEATADFRTATDLADRVLKETIDWLDDDLLLSQREWIAQAKGHNLTWKSIPIFAGKAGIKARGLFADEAGVDDAKMARRAILYLLNEFDDLDAIMLIRDQDDKPERHKGLNQARNDDHSGVVIVIGVATVERECWVVSGFDPQNEGESSRLKTEHTSVHFDPRTRSHDLTNHKDPIALRSPKRVLRQLSGDDPDRERRCWTDTSLDVLRERGIENGLAEYLKEVRERLAPLIGHVSHG